MSVMSSPDPERVREALEHPFWRNTDGMGPLTLAMHDAARAWLAGSSPDLTREQLRAVLEAEGAFVDVSAWSDIGHAVEVPTAGRYLVWRIEEGGSPQ